MSVDFQDTDLPSISIEDDYDNKCCDELLKKIVRRYSSWITKVCFFSSSAKLWRRRRTAA